MEVEIEQVFFVGRRRRSSQLSLNAVREIQHKIQTGTLTSSSSSSSSSNVNIHPNPENTALYNTTSSTPSNNPNPNTNTTNIHPNHNLTFHEQLRTNHNENHGLKGTLDHHHNTKMAVQATSNANTNPAQDCEVNNGFNPEQYSGEEDPYSPLLDAFGERSRALTYPASASAQHSATIETSLNFVGPIPSEASLQALKNFLAKSDSPLLVRLPVPISNRFHITIDTPFTHVSSVHASSFFPSYQTAEEKRAWGHRRCSSLDVTAFH